MPLLGNKPKQKEKLNVNDDNVSPEQWIKNSGHSLKGIFLEWLSEQKLFAIIDGEIKRIKKENQRKKNMTPEDKLAWKRKAAKLSDETIAKFGKEYLGQNSAEETKEYIRNGLNTVANQIKTGNFYKKASLFGDEDMDKFMEDLEAEWDEDEFSSSGESYRKPYREFMITGTSDKRPIFTSKKIPNLERVVSKYGPHFFQDSYGPGELQDDYDFNIYLYTDGPQDDVSDIQVELYNKLTKDKSFIKELEKTVAKEGVRDQKKNGVFTLCYIYGADIYPDGTMEIAPLYGYKDDEGDEYSDEGEPYVIKTYKKESKGENYSSRYKAFRKPYREFMSVNDMGKTFDKGVDKLYQMKYGMSQDEYFKKHFPGKPAEKYDDHQYDYKLKKNPSDDTYNYTVHIDTPFPGHFNVTIKNKDAERPSATVKSILENMSKIEALWKKYISTPKFKKEFESEWESTKYTIDTEGEEWLEGVESEMELSGLAKDPMILKKDLWKYATDPEDVWLYYNEGEDKIQVVFGYYLEYVQQGFDWEVKLKDIGITTTKGESYFMKYKAMGEFSKGGSDKNVFTIGLGDIKRYEGLLKIYTSTKKSIRGFVSKVIKLANKDVNEAKEYANKNDVDSLLDKMSDADNNLLDEMSDLVKSKLEPKNLPTNVAKKMKSYLDKQHKVFNSYDMPEDLYNKWKEIYSSNESDPTMKAINNTARFFEPNTVNGSDYTKVFDKFKDFKVSVPTPAAEMMYLTQRESVLSNYDIEELSNAIDKYNAMKREYGPKLLKVMNTVMNNKEDLDQGEITIDDFDLEEFSASDASYDLEKAIKNIDAINFDKSDYTTKERLRQEFKHLMDVCDFEVIPRSDSEKWKKFSEDNYSSRFSSQYPDIVEFVDRELSYIEKDFLASKEFKNIYKRVGEAKLNDIINKSPIGENFIKRLGGKR